MKKFGDRKDGVFVRKIDGFHLLMMNAYPRRTECEACVFETVDLSSVNSYLNEKNSSIKDSKFTMFQFVVSVLAKTLILRPNLNNFIVNKKLYVRKYHSVAFIIKKKFEDSADEGLAVFRFDENDNIDSIHEFIELKINSVIDDDENTENFNLNFVSKCPQSIIRLIFPFIRFLDKHGKLPSSISDDDPNYSSMFVTNLGSIDLNSGFHHLNEWGTTSLFFVIGKKQYRPFYSNDGKFEMKDSLEFGLIVDERIADGYYFAKSIKLAKYLFEHPEELDKPFKSPVTYE